MVSYSRKEMVSEIGATIAKIAMIVPQSSGF
jgi:hypothetical protein